MSDFVAQVASATGFSVSEIVEASRYIGVAGAGTYLTAYGSLQLKLIDGNSVHYTCMNMFAATLVLISLSVDFNPASAVIQIAWLVFGSIGIAITVLRRLNAPQATPGAGQSVISAV